MRSRGQDFGLQLQTVVGSKLLLRGSRPLLWGSKLLQGPDCYSGVQNVTERVQNVTERLQQLSSASLCLILHLPHLIQAVDTLILYIYRILFKLPVCSLSKRRRSKVWPVQWWCRLTCSKLAKIKFFFSVIRIRSGQPDHLILIQSGLVWNSWSGWLLACKLAIYYFSRNESSRNDLISKRRVNFGLTTIKSYDNIL